MCPIRNLHFPGPHDPTVLSDCCQRANTWTPRAVAELVEGLGGAVVATHSQSGLIGYHMVRVLKEHGKLDLLKGLIQERQFLQFCKLLNSPPQTSKISRIWRLRRLFCESGAHARPRLTPSRQLVVRPIISSWTRQVWWQGSYAGPFGPAYVGPFAGVSHMHMIESNPSPAGQATNLQVMDVMLKWADMNISKPKTAPCPQQG